MLDGNEHHGHDVPRVNGTAEDFHIHGEGWGSGDGMGEGNGYFKPVK